MPCSTENQAHLDSISKLSKSRFMAGHQCLKRLYLESYATEAASEIDPVTQALFDTGHAVGAVARERFPGGVLIANDYLEHELATEGTLAAMKDPTVPAIYEAAFTHDDVRIRADILVRRRGDWFDLVEVKSTTRVKAEHEWDLAVQLHVLDGAGVKIHRAHLMHLDRGYVYEGGDYDLARLFACEDLTETARTRLATVSVELAAMRRALQEDEPPPVAVGPHCESPYLCSFYDHCHAGLPDDPFDALPRITNKLRTRLAAAGIDGIGGIPLDFRGLSQIQKRALEALRGRQRVVEPAIRELLKVVRFPVQFVDFETFMPALPLYAGTRPYDTIPFQWSNHVLDESGSVIHHEFLRAGAGDPRREFIERLLDATRDGGSVVVYSNYEDCRLADLEAALPDLACDIRALRGRLFDLLPAIRQNVYDPGFEGSFSIKAVLPAMIPGLGYDDLAICHGALASVAFGEMLSLQTSSERRTEVRADLLAYCKRDTEAMLELFKALR